MSSESDLLKRLATSIAALVIGGLIGSIAIPGAVLPSGQVLSRVGDAGLGSLITGFIVVELAAMAVPSWRSHLRGGPQERALLWRYAVLLALPIAAFQGAMVGQILSVTEEAGGIPLANPNARPPAALIAFAFALCVALWGYLASRVDRGGLGAGLGLGALAGRIPEMWTSIEPQIAGAEARDVLPGAALTAASVAWMYRSSSAATTLWSGWSPVGASIAVLLVLENLGWGASVAGLGAFGALVAGAVGVTAVRPFRRIAALGRPDRRTFEWRLAAGHAGVPRAIIGTIALGLFLGGPFLTASGFALVGAPLGVTVIAAMVLDVVDELRARRATAAMVPAWTLPQLWHVEPARRALGEAGIPCHVRSVRYRSMTGIFDPSVPLDVLVPEAQIAEARAVIARALEATEPDPEPPGPVAPGGQPTPPTPAEIWSPPHK